jgi:hypothetical protein
MCFCKLDRHVAYLLTGGTMPRKRKVEIENEEVGQFDDGPEFVPFDELDEEDLPHTEGPFFEDDFGFGDEEE